MIDKDFLLYTTPDRPYSKLKTKKQKRQKICFDIIFYVYTTPHLISYDKWINLYPDFPNVSSPVHTRHLAMHYSMP